MATFDLFPYNDLAKIFHLLPPKFWTLQNHKKTPLFQRVVLVNRDDPDIATFTVDHEKEGPLVGDGVGTLTIYNNAWRNRKLFALTVMHKMGHTWEKSIQRTNTGLYNLLVDNGQQLAEVMPYVWPMYPGNKFDRHVLIFGSRKNEPLAEAFALFVTRGDMLRWHIKKLQHRFDEEPEIREGFAAWKLIYEQIRRDLGKEYFDLNVYV